MKKLIIASLLASASFGATASENTYICAATGVSDIENGGNSTYMIRESAIIIDNVNKVSVDFYGMKSTFNLEEIEAGKFVSVFEDGSIFVKRVNSGKVSFMSSSDGVSGVKFQPCIKV